MWFFSQWRVFHQNLFVQSILYKCLKCMFFYRNFYTKLFFHLTDVEATILRRVFPQQILLFSNLNLSSISSTVSTSERVCLSRLILLEHFLLWNSSSFYPACSVWVFLQIGMHCPRMVCIPFASNKCTKSISLYNFLFIRTVFTFD